MEMCRHWCHSLLSMTWTQQHKTFISLFLTIGSATMLEHFSHSIFRLVYYFDFLTMYQRAARYSAILGFGCTHQGPVS
jgi:hypothetical protein